MAQQDEADVTDRLRRALLAFQSAQLLLLTAERKLKDLPGNEVEAFWVAPGGRIERHVRTTAEKVAEAFKAFSAGTCSSLVSVGSVGEHRRSS